jgi:predicted nucleic acid-binding protein
MKLVIDSSVALKWALAEPNSDKSLAIRDGYLKQIHELLVPDVFPIEVAHALAKAERRNLLAPPLGSEHLSDILAILPPVHPSIPLLPRAYEIASAVRIGVYDCLYVALAERERCEFVTADQKLITNLQKEFPFIVSLDSVQP